MIQEWRRGDYLISTDRARLDIAVIHQFLTTSYWAAGIPLETVRRSIAHSLNFGLYKGGQQIGFARVITDYTTFAYLGDVFILEEFRGQGLSRWLMESISTYPELQGLRRWILLTRDAHWLYRKVGFTEVRTPERYMEKHDPCVYERAQAAGSTD